MYNISEQSKPISNPNYFGQNTNDANMDLVLQNDNQMSVDFKRWKGLKRCEDYDCTLSIGNIKNMIN